MAKLKPYTKYKDSGLKWLGKIPEDWVIQPLISAGKIKKITGQTHRELLSVYLNKGVIRFTDVDEKRTNVTSKDLSKYQSVDEGDFVLNNQQAWRGSVGVSSYKGIVSPAYLIVKLDPMLDPEFANYMFRDKSLVSQFLIYSKGVGSIQRNLYWNDLKRIDLFIPPKETQKIIANYLNAKSKEIDKYVKKLKKEIALFKEHRQKVISQAVTCGLDENGKLRKKPEWNEGDAVPNGWKNSGVEWLGLIPEDWKQLPGRAFFTEKKIKNVGMQEKQVLSLSYGKIIKKKDEDLKGLVPESFETYQIVSDGDIIIRSTDLQNDKVSLRVGLVKDIGIITSAYLCLKVNHNLTSEYAYHLLHSYDIRKIFYSLGSGLRQNLSITDFKFLPVVQPPNHEQKNIVSYVIDKTESIDKQIREVEKQINYIQEYKQSLISKVVTGKIDVRNINNNLSED